MTGLATALRRILGEDGVLDRPEDLAGYRDDLAVKGDARTPLVVVRPRATGELSEVMKVCAAAGAAVTPRGGGTGLSGGATVTGAARVIASFERMRRIRRIDAVGDTMLVEAGCTLHEARQAAAQAGRLLGLDHGGASSQIGGNLATNAGGNNVLRYGMAREQVLGIEAVMADGAVLSRLAPMRKSNAGYDWKQLLLGSEGTLALVTAATLRLRPAPTVRATACLGLETPAAALRLLALARSTLGETISACELLSQPAVDVSLRHHPAYRHPLAAPTAWLLLLEADSASRHFDVEGAMHALLEEAFGAGLVTDGTVAANEGQREALWRLREGIAAGMIETQGTLKSDTAVPVAAVPDFIARATEAVIRVVPGCRPAPFGHLGDGNIHFNVLPPSDMPGSVFHDRWPELMAAIAEVSLALDGTVSAEHGIGLLKRAELARMLPAAELDLMRRLKAAFDPGQLLNPGKIFPTDH